MKICFITDEPFDIGGGPEHIRQVVEVLRKRYGCLIDVVTPKTMDKNFNFFNFGERLKYIFWTIKVFLEADYEIYHSHSFSTCIFLPLAKLRGRKIGVTVHGLGQNLIGGGFLNTTFIPKLGMKLLLNVWPYDFRLSASHVSGFVRVGNGVDVSEFDQGKFQSDFKYFTVLCVSRRDPVKGIKFLQSAIKLVQKKYPQVKLNLVSGRRRTVKDFKTANLYVLPSLSEGLPIVLLEAMAAKLPIITTDVGDCRSLVENAHCGLVVYPGSSRDLAKAIIKTIKNKRAFQFGENGYQYVKKNYSWESVAQRVYQSYQTV